MVLGNVKSIYKMQVINGWTNLLWRYRGISKIKRRVFKWLRKVNKLPADFKLSDSHMTYLSGAVM